MTFDERVQALTYLDFTPRQTRFLVTVALHSGFCVRRQFAAFAGVEYGKNVRNFLDQLVERQLGRRLQFEINRGHVYHLSARSVYRAIGQDGNRNRRTAAPPSSLGSSCCSTSSWRSRLTNGRPPRTTKSRCLVTGSRSSSRTEPSAQGFTRFLWDHRGLLAFRCRARGSRELVYMDDDSEITVRGTGEGSEGNILWFYIRGKRYAFRYDHEHEAIELRIGTHTGDVLRQYTNRTPISSIKLDFGLLR